MSPFVLIEDRLAAPGETFAWLFEQAVGEFFATDHASLAAILARIEAFEGWQVVSVSYEASGYWEPTTKAGLASGPLLRLWQFSSCRQLGKDETDAFIESRFAMLPEQQRGAGIGGIEPAMSLDEYRVAADKVLAYIRAGDCYQVNLTFPLLFSTWGDPFSLYRILRCSQPVRYGGFILDSSGNAVLSLSPELFVEKRGKVLRTRPMKGTAPRSEPSANLSASEKDRAENLMIVDLLRNDLGRLARTGSVTVKSLFEIEAYPTLWQMVSEIQAESKDCSFSALLAALFPCGSITGAPKIRAMQIARECEGGRTRGLYTGTLGWLAPKESGASGMGDCRLNVAIRTLEISADGHGCMGVGSGIVADSIPETEWEECLLKSHFLHADTGGLQLIETLRREQGRYPRLSLHMQRLAQSAKWLGFCFNPVQVEAVLASIADPAPLMRVRLTLARDGKIEVSASPIAGADASCWQVIWATATINSRHPLQRHKTTWRAHYDRALSQHSMTTDFWDAVFLNERGEVAEGARSNVFLRRDGVFLTPPLSSGALPGVLRSELLSAGVAREQVLMPADLENGELWMGNAVRGLLRCRF